MDPHGRSFFQHHPAKLYLRTSEGNRYATRHWIMHTECTVRFLSNYQNISFMRENTQPTRNAATIWAARAWWRIWLTNCGLVHISDSSFPTQPAVLLLRQRREPDGLQVKILQSHSGLWDWTINNKIPQNMSESHSVQVFRLFWKDNLMKYVFNCIALRSLLEIKTNLTVFWRSKHTPWVLVTLYSGLFVCCFICSACELTEKLQGHSNI